MWCLCTACSGEYQNHTCWLVLWCSVLSLAATVTLRVPKARRGHVHLDRPLCFDTACGGYVHLEAPVLKTAHGLFLVKAVCGVVKRSCAVLAARRPR